MTEETKKEEKKHEHAWEPQFFAVDDFGDGLNLITILICNRDGCEEKTVSITNAYEV